MRKQLENLRVVAREDADGPAADFFASAFLDRDDESPRLVSWAERAPLLGVQPYDRARGEQRFCALLASDRHAAALGSDGIARLAAFLEFVSVPEGREVIAQDEQGDYLLVVLEGTVAVDRVQPWGERHRLGESRAGEILGEMSLLDAGTRFSSCITRTPCVLAVLGAQSLDRLLKEEPRLAAALLAALARRLSLRLRQVGARLSALLSRD